jgi:Transglutaminase-like superfamily
LACLPQSMARHSMLRRRGIESTLYIGVRPQVAGGVDIHAWTAVGPTVVPGEDVASYSVVATFS